MGVVLVTGGYGFIGSHYVRYLIKNTDNVVINIDKLTYSSNLENLRDVENNPRYKFYNIDLAKSEELKSILETKATEVVHLAAESHVDRSISDSWSFINSNIIGTYNLLECCRKLHIEKFVHVSTDEVYGTILNGAVDEEATLKPRNPYSASKASSDLLALSYYHTHKLPVVVTRCTNNYGPNQHPEKLIPNMIKRLKIDEPVNIYGDGKQERDWLYVGDHCSAIELVRRKGHLGEVYNIGAECTMPNIILANTVLDMLNKPKSLIEYVADRPGHDLRYSLDSTKIRKELGWSSSVGIQEGLSRTISWYTEEISNSWWKSVKM